MSRESGPGKGERTRETILVAALELMAERGFEATTMRAIAERAAVSLGNAYYYFATKEHLVWAFYERTHEQHVAACERSLAGEGRLSSRLQAALRSHAVSMAPHHAFAASLFRSAADPASPLSPFGEGSRSVRERAISLFDRVVEGSTDSMPSDLRAWMPRLLWLLHMGLVLFWMHDRSRGRQRTLRLIDGISELVGSLVGLSALPFAGPLRRRTLALVEDAWGSAP